MVGIDSMNDDDDDDSSSPAASNLSNSFFLKSIPSIASKAFSLDPSWIALEVSIFAAATFNAVGCRLRFEP